MFAWTEESAAFWEDSASYTQSYERLAERAAARLSPEGNLFEGGCGLGHLSVALAKRGFAVTAMDLSPLPLRYLRANADRVNWAKGHCRDRLILFKKNWSTHRFTRDPGVLRKYTYPLTCEELTLLGLPFETEVFNVDMGQPFRSLPDAVRFFRLYDPQAAMTEGEALSRLTKTGDPVFPYYLPALRSVGMIVIQTRDIPR